MQLDTVLQIASMTKLLTTISVLQLVEQGKVGLDDDAIKYIPELVNEGVLKGVGEDGKANIDKVDKPLTLR